MRYYLTSVRIAEFIKRIKSDGGDLGKKEKENSNALLVEMQTDPASVENNREFP